LPPAKFRAGGRVFLPPRDNRRNAAEPLRVKLRLSSFLRQVRELPRFGCPILPGAKPGSPSLPVIASLGNRRDEVYCRKTFVVKDLFEVDR
jgi:hypothetical protein